MADADGAASGGDDAPQSSQSSPPSAHAPASAPESENGRDELYSTAADVLSQFDALSKVAMLTTQAGGKPESYPCTYEGCGRKFKTPGALHTHTGWHKRRDNMDNGIYERQCHTQKETHHVTDGKGTLHLVKVYRCQEEGCGKLFQTRGALFTHMGWHKRKPHAKRGFSSAGSVVTGAGQKIEVPRKRFRKEHNDAVSVALHASEQAQRDVDLAQQISLQQAALKAQMQQMTANHPIAGSGYSVESLYAGGNLSGPQTQGASNLSSGGSFPPGALALQQAAFIYGMNAQAEPQPDLGPRGDHFQLPPAAKQQWLEAARNLQLSDQGAHVQPAPMDQQQYQQQYQPQHQQPYQHQQQAQHGQQQEKQHQQLWGAVVDRLYDERSV